MSDDLNPYTEDSVCLTGASRTYVLTWKRGLLILALVGLLLALVFGL